MSVQRIADEVLSYPYTQNFSESLADTYLFDMSYCSEEFVTHLEGYAKEWVSAVESDARVT